MATVTTPPQVAAPERERAGVGSLPSRAPSWVLFGGTAIVLVVASAYMRSRALSGQLWIDEAITTGISGHALGSIPGILRHDGNPPLYYLLLHFWMRAFGSSESATHTL